MESPISGFPNLDEEEALSAAGYRHIAALDEAGRGAWAGPLYAAAVILPLERRDLAQALEGVRDSKLLRPKRREELLQTIRAVARAIGVGWASPQEIDDVGVVPATHMAMRRALAKLPLQPCALLIDHLQIPGLRVPQRSLSKADMRCLSVAAASIVAKVERDRYMAALDDQYPGYDMARHNGYGTRAHRQALAKLGPCAIHRMSWRPMREGWAK